MSLFCAVPSPVGLLSIVMAENDSDTSQSSNSNLNSPIESDAEIESDAADGAYAVVSSHTVAYADIPLAVPGEEAITDETDKDGLSPHTLEMRSDQNIPLNEW